MPVKGVVVDEAINEDFSGLEDLEGEPTSLDKEKPTFRPKYKSPIGLGKSARIQTVRQRLALTLTEHVKSKMTDFMKRKPQDRSKQENELFGDMMNENSKSKMMLLTNLESTRDDRVLKPEDRDEEGYITNAWGDTQGTSIKSLDPAESGLDTMNRQQVDYDKQKLLRRSTTNAFSRDEAEKRLNDITEEEHKKVINQFYLLIHSQQEYKWLGKGLQTWKIGKMNTQEVWVRHQRIEEMMNLVIK